LENAVCGLFCAQDPSIINKTKLLKGRLSIEITKGDWLIFLTEILTGLRSGQILMHVIRVR
jgi:hypothetical protein